MKEVSRVFMSLSKSVEMRLALWSAPVMQFLFHLVGTSDFQCVNSEFSLRRTKESFLQASFFLKQVISYVSKLFPSGITEDIYVRVDGHLFNPDDGKQPKTFGLNILIF